MNIQWYVSVVVLYLVLFTTALPKKRRYKVRNIAKNRKLRMKGIKKLMPVEMIKECIGKEVTICVEGELGGFVATVLSVEDNWIKVEQKNCVRYINGDMITQLKVNKEKTK